MKVSLFVHDLSSNPIVRAVPIARALIHLGHEVEIIGFTINSDNIFEPYKNEFNYKTIRTYLDIRSQILKSPQLAKLAEGEVIYAFKPLWSSLFPALIASKFGIKKKLILDIEDNEYWEEGAPNTFRQFLRNPWYPKNKIYTKLLFPFTKIAKHKTVVCKSLQNKYGGIIVLHGPDANAYNPNNLPNIKELRKKYGLPINSKLLLFAGRSVSYNGLDNIISALMDNRTKDWKLVLAGNPSQEMFKLAKNKLNDRCFILGMIPNSDMPEIIKLADAIPILQTLCPATEMQIPAKLIEALSMGKPIIGSDVCDIPDILKAINQNELIIDRYNLVNELIRILSKNSIQIKEQQKQQAISFFKKNASTESIASKINHFFNN